MRRKLRKKGNGKGKREERQNNWIKSKKRTTKLRSANGLRTKCRV
jgi:hypothetical protein